MRSTSRVLLAIAAGMATPAARSFVPRVGPISKISRAVSSRDRFRCHAALARRRSLACSAAKAEREPTSSSSGRASAAVLQDAERRADGRPMAVEQLDLKPSKGTRDVFPEDMRLRNW